MANFSMNLRSVVSPAQGGNSFDLRQPSNRPASSTSTSPVSKHSPAHAVYGKKKSRAIEDAIGHELKMNEPAVVGHTREKFGAKRAAKQKVAILLSKARKRGAKV